MARAHPFHVTDVEFDERQSADLHNAEKRQLDRDA